MRIKYNSGFFLTTNEYPDFGNERDCQAIRTRLDVFQSTSLPRKDKKPCGLKISAIKRFEFSKNEVHINCK